MFRVTLGTFNIELLQGVCTDTVRQYSVLLIATIGKTFQDKKLILVFNAIGHKDPRELVDKHVKHFNEEQ